MNLLCTETAKEGNAVSQLETGESQSWVKTCVMGLHPYGPLYHWHFFSFSLNRTTFLGRFTTYICGGCYQASPVSAWRLNFYLITLYKLSGVPLTLSDQMESKHSTISLHGSILKHHPYCFYLLEKAVAAMWKMLCSSSSTTTSFLLCPAFINFRLAYDGITDRILELANKNKMFC